MTMSEKLGKMLVKPAPDNPWLYEETARPMTHWEVVIQHEGRQLKTVFSMGPGYKGREPRIDEVLVSLFDGYKYSEFTFKEYCEKFGYSIDSKSDRNMWRNHIETASQLEQLYGPHFDEVKEIVAQYGDRD